MQRLHVRAATIAIVMLLLSAPIRADYFWVEGFLEDSSSPGAPQLTMYANSERMPAAPGQAFTAVYAFIDGKVVQSSPDAPWQSMTMIYDAGATEHWQLSVPVSAGWHSVDFLGRTADDQWIWSTETKWISIGS